MRVVGLVSIYCKREFYYPIASLVAIINTYIVFIIQSSLWGKILNTNYEFYFALIMLISTFTSFSTERDIASEYQEGVISVQLIKPLSYMYLMVVSDLAQVVAAFILRTLPVLILLLILKNRVFLEFRDVPMQFALSIGLASCMSWLVAYSIGIAVVYSGSNEGMIQAKNLIVMLLSGAAIPYTLFPEAFLKILRFSPFAVLYILPYEAAPQRNNPIILLTQIFWVAAMLVVAWGVNRNVMKRIVYAGG